MTFFGLKSSQDLENRAAHPYQEFPGVPPGGLPRSRLELFSFQQHTLAAYKVICRGILYLRLRKLSCYRLCFYKVFSRPVVVTREDKKST